MHVISQGQGFEFVCASKKKKEDSASPKDKASNVLSKTWNSGFYLV